MRGRCALAALLLAPLAPAQAQLGPPLEHPEAVQRFAERLRALEGGAAQRVRITHFGDSHIAADLYTAPLREAWQARWGDGGRGFLLAGKPWPSYRQQQMKAQTEGPWRTDGLRGGVEDGWYGPGGCSSAAEGPGARFALQVPPTGPGVVADVHLLRQPHGGCLEVSADGTPLGRLSSAGPWLAAGFSRVPLPAGTHSLEITARGQGEVRLFGVSFEGPAGVIYDALGINGAHATRLLRPEAQGFLDGVGRLAPDLVILSFGTNELYSGDLDVARHGLHLGRVLARVRAAAPQADCLLTGPPDFLRHGRPVPETAELYRVQRRVAAEQGCAFWDAQAAMGGPGSVKRWRRQGLAQRDYVHLTRDGYVRLGEALRAALEATLAPPP